MGRVDFIEKHKDLFWYTPADKKPDVSDALLIETIFNYGTLDDCRELVKILTPEHVAKVFFSSTERQKLNYYPEIYNFFSLALRKYVQ